MRWIIQLFQVAPCCDWRPSINSLNGVRNVLTSASRFYWFVARFNWYEEPAVNYLDNVDGEGLAAARSKHTEDGLGS